jgi:hypothetical protein
VKFRRKASDPAEVDEAQDEPQPEETGTGSGRHGARGGGPWDSSELDLDPDDQSRIDLGGLLMSGHTGLELQLQVDEASGTVGGVLLAGQDGALELRPFAAPRNGDVWEDIRKQIAAEVTRQGGTATELEGPYGTELRVRLTVTRPDGTAVNQPSRVLGIAGPRWLLRATMFGRPAVEPDEDGDLETALRDVVVVRGTIPLPPGAPLPLTMPPGAQRVDPPTA